MAGLLGILGATTTGMACGATLESLLMPGPLSKAHAKLEADCSSCHNRANRDQQRELCSACHKDIAADLRNHTGLHGRRPEIAAAQCSACHSEHRGRDGSITPTASPTFNHQRTDFRLDGAHLPAPCASCHTAGKPHREAPSRCVDCHRKIEPHAGRLGEDCAGCHNTARWSDVRYDHSRTRFALRGQHAKIPCAACHAGNRWQRTPTACASCHTPDDVHRGQRGTDCGSCHTENSWRDARFDHEKETGFALNGAHKTAACQACHRSGRFEDKLEKTCAGCHKAADAHAGRMGDKCESCHDESRWKVTRFVHERDTKFTLRGAHSNLACHSCHVAAVTRQKPAQQCVACHRAADPHATTLGTDCASCHGVTSWKSDLRFDHDLTAFPLVGQHVTVPCARCHTTLRFAKQPRVCVDCHRDQDVHRGRFDRDCSHCHNANAWNIWRFDHKQQSGFELTGAHAKARCNSCHTRPAGEVKLGRDCASCHATDDPHLGQFGRRCDTCHATTTFHRAKPQ
jgi:hypothetical protein